MNIKDIMSYNAPYNQKNIESIIENIQRNNIVPYIGAGMSVLFNGIYPTWSAFLDKTYKEFCDSSIYSENEFYSLCLEKRAEYLYNEIGNISFSEYLKETFSLQHLDVKNDEFYNKPAYLLPKVFEKGLLITTNYDKVIEKCYMLHGKALTVLHPGHFEALNGALRNNDLLLYKVHGDINEPIESIIITEEQYNKAYSNSTLTDSLKQICLSKSILFLGCSLSNDRPITLLRNTSHAGIFHYAIIPCEKSQIKARRIELENEYFTKSIIYPVENHECVFEILNYIERKINNNINKKIKERHINIDDQWFINQNKTQIKNLGDRYLPDLNVKTNVIHVFDALSRNNEFYNRFTEKSDRLLSNIFSLELPKIQEYAEEILDLIKSFSLNVDTININQIKNNLDKIYDIISIELKNIKNDNFNSREYMFYKFITTINIINDYINYILSDEMKVINNPYILLHGEGGIGKSHLIADVITQRMEQNKKSLLLLGQHFKTTNPTQEILNLLNLSCTFQDLLKTLNDIGMKDNSRIVLFVDALNEGNGKTIWNEHLAGIIEQIKHFPWICCVVSIRTEYIADIFENNTALKNTFVSIRHTGFSTLEYKAVKKYFEYYEIKYFDISLLEQEFRNPLFLRLLCESVKNQKINLDRINFTDIYTNYLKAINNKIALKCGYSKHINVVEKVINEIVNYKYIKNSKINFILLEDCIEIITNIEKSIIFHYHYWTN